MALPKTPKTTSTNDIMLLRRERVTELRGKGKTARAIMAALGDPDSDLYMVNPNTKKPYELGTIHADLVVIRRDAQARIAETIDAHRADQLVEIQQIKRGAWEVGRLDWVLRALEREAKILGIDSEDRLNVNLQMPLMKEVIEAIERGGLRPSDVFNAMLQELAARGGTTPHELAQTADNAARVTRLNEIFEAARARRDAALDMSKLSDAELTLIVNSDLDDIDTSPDDKTEDGE